MATTIKHKFGHRPCLDCGERVVVFKSEHGTLSYSCQECGSNGYAKEHEPRYKLWMAKITPLEEKKQPAEPEKERPAASGGARPKFLGG